MEIIPQLPFADYAKRPGINATLLKAVDGKSMLHAKAVIDGADSEESDAKSLGTSFHAQLLEGRIDYCVTPETYQPEKGAPKPWSWNATVCKEWGTAQTLTILSPAEAKHIEAMVSAATDALRGLDLTGDRELSIFAEKDGLPVKTRLDLLLADPSDPIIDFKSTTDANPDKFLKQCADLRYHLQCAWQIDVARWAGIERKEVWLVGIESKPPYATCVLRFKDEPMTFLRVGRARCRAAFQKLKTAYASNLWPDYGRETAEDFAKPWQMQELEQTA